MEARVFVGWEEVAVSNDKGRRVVNYYVKDSEGRRELAVVGKEKSARHMIYMARDRFLRSLLMAKPSIASPLSSVSSSDARLGCRKWKSKREVVDWLSEIVADSVSPGPSILGNGFLDEDDVEPTDIPIPKGLSSGKIRPLAKEFSWLGPAWTCRKRRKHYRSFCRNKITISVHDFVYVLVEENKRLIAYVEDLYEDLRAHNMVAVRWFHRVDEIGTILPPDVNDREIFFSLCLQDFSVECIDGLAAVLSAEDFHKFQKEARHRFSSWDPYMCRRQIDNDDVKPFDITQLQGYWSQEVLRSMYSTSGTPMKLRLKITHGSPSSSLNQDGQIEPKKKRRRLNGDNIEAQGVSRDVNKPRVSAVVSRGERPGSGYAATDMLRKQLLKNKLEQQQQHLARGCRVEVLSQDSGMRGCWFQCVVLKKHHEKVKVQYQDVQDADDNSNLQEWVLASRVASPDKLGIRSCGRLVVRPDPSHDTEFSSSLCVGSIVDARWHDGWWEGIIIEKVPEEKFRVYFPGERRVSTFARSDLRPSQDWVANKWNCIEDRPDVASFLLSDMDRENLLCSPGDDRPVLAPVEAAETRRECSDACKQQQQRLESGELSAHVIPNLWLGLDGMRWNKHKRRMHLKSGGKRSKRQFGSKNSSGVRASAEFSLPKPLMGIDHEKCKSGGDPLFATLLALCSF